MAQKDWSRCRLAVLSACSTGTGEARGPVNPESLVRGLLWAGVARVVASRWNMDSETGAALMERFYDRLLSGDDVAKALQRAAQSLRENAETSHPYFWAGFQNFGAR
jgi:CHAT domain-containing protein